MRLTIYFDRARAGDADEDHIHLVVGVLDEPTANLDPVTERELLDAVYDLMRDRAALVITHRLVRMEEMDEILVLERGRIVERGTHKELEGRRGYIARCSACSVIFSRFRRALMLSAGIPS